MGLIKKADVIKAYNARQTTILEESRGIETASRELSYATESFSGRKIYDVFLSHSFQDARVVEQIYEQLSNEGLSVYVDWIEDNHLERGKVTNHTASVLKTRMNSCFALIYLTSISATSSVWMPWELGYMDAKTNKVAVAPILEDYEDDDDFEGREYLGLYPYLDLTHDDFYIHSDDDNYIKLSNWLNGEKP